MHIVTKEWVEKMIRQHVVENQKVDGSSIGRSLRAQSTLLLAASFGVNEMATMNSDQANFAIQMLTSWSAHAGILNDSESSIFVTDRSERFVTMLNGFKAD